MASALLESAATGVSTLKVPHPDIDPLFLAHSRFRRRKFQECVDICSALLAKNPYDQASWGLKARALTEQVYVDEVEVEDEGIAEILDDNAISQLSRPGTSLKTAQTSGGPSPAFRPVSQSGRPVSGFVRPGTQTGAAGGSVETALRSARTAATARPVSATTGRFVRLGTASMLSSQDGPFINIARLNFAKYGERANLARSLFEYIFHHENDVRNALELASAATKSSQYADWWWKLAIAKCYHRIGMYRDAERQLKSALVLQQTVDLYLYLGRVYMKLDQPLSAAETFRNGLTRFPSEAVLETALARVYELLGDQPAMVEAYRKVLLSDGSHVEAISCIATHYFYSDQPELALRCFRRLLQMGVYNAELFNNIGLSCYHSGQFDMALGCFERAIALSNDVQRADVWYNLGTVVVHIGNSELAAQCFKLALSNNPDLHEAYNNLAVLEARSGSSDSARSFFLAATNLGGGYECSYNLGLLSESAGDLQAAYTSTQKALESFATHVDSLEVFRRIKKHFGSG